MISGRPPLVEQDIRPRPVTQWTAGLGSLLREGERVEHPLATTLPLELRLTSTCLWLITQVTRSVRIGLRAVFDPAGLHRVKLSHRSADHVRLTAEGGFGTYELEATLLPAEGDQLLRLQLWLTPAADCHLEAMPRDICALDAHYDPSREDARLLTSQVGRMAGHLYVHVRAEPGASMLYFQNFTALADYFRTTGATHADTVKAEWPDCAFAIPPGPQPMPAGRRMAVRDTFLRLRAGLPDREAGAAEWFLGTLAAIHTRLAHPATPYVDWPALATRSLRTLQRRPACRRTIDGRAYFQAYVGGAGKPPESMVQGALVVPMLEFEHWRGRAVPMLREFEHVPTSFFDEDLSTPLRWLPGADWEKDERSEEEQHFLTDSWYLLHTLCNLGRMAEFGLSSAREVFLKSLARLVRTAHHFGYDWPVFYDQRNFAVRKEETGPGAGGEQDANGLYIHIMLQAHTLTHDATYLAEAETAAEKLSGLAFGILYQTNNTAFGAVALTRLWRATGNRLYRDLSVVAIGSVLSHLWLWDLGPETFTYMGLPPLHDAPYIAFYEEAEVLAALQAWLVAMGEEVPAGASLLIAEYTRHLLARGTRYYPANLPEDGLAEAKEGPIQRSLLVPIEGLGAPGEKAGTVGQAVYACGAPFILATRAWHRPKPAPFILACSYPLLHLDFEGTTRRGAVRFTLAGDAQLSCEVRILPRTRRRGSAVILRTQDSGAEIPLEKDDAGARVATVPGSSRLMVTWGD